MQEIKKYFIRLDIIRIIACIAVLLYHLGILKGGYLAVCTFFTLSGYLVCMSELNNKEFSIKKYYFSRIKKIYIPLLVVVFITVIITKLNTNVNWLNLKKETISVIFGYNNFWQLSANLDYFTRNINSPFTHLWYISILMQFDLIFPVIFAILRKIGKKINNNIPTVIVFLFMLITTGVFFYMSTTHDIMKVYYSTIARSFSIIFGIYLALIHHEYKITFSRVSQKHNLFIFMLYTIILIAMFIFVQDKSNYYSIFMILATLITTRLIKYSIIGEERREKSNKTINILARSTYEIYLVQYPVIFFMKGVSINETLKVVLIITITIIISYILHFLISSKLKSKVGKILRVILITTVIIFGSFFVITEKDNTAEMKELEEMLNKNAQLMEEKNKNYINDISEDKKEDIITNNKISNDNVINTFTGVKNSVKNNTELTEVDEKNIADKVSKLHVVGIGDSVLLDAINEFYKKFPNGYFDGKVSRTLYAAKDVVKNLKSKGKLGNTLILCLATNGDYSNKINKDFMNLVGDRQIYWVNAVGADDPKFNEKFKKFAEEYPNIHIVEWDVEAKKHPEYFYSDKVHMKPGEGMKAYVNCIYQAIYNDYLEKAKKH